MPKKIKSPSKAFLDALRAKIKSYPHKKIIVCRCWPGIYEAACRLSNRFSHENLDDENLSMSEFINIIIGAYHLLTFGDLPDSGNEFSNISKGEK